MVPKAIPELTRVDNFSSESVGKPSSPKDLHWGEWRQFGGPVIIRFGIGDHFLTFSG